MKDYRFWLGIKTFYSVPI